MSTNEYRKIKRNKAGRPVAAPKTPHTRSFKICSNCFTKLYNGYNHSAESCKSSRSKIVYVENMVRPTTLQRASSRIDKDPPSESVGAALGRQKKFKEEVRTELFTAYDICGIKQDLRNKQ